MGMPKALLSFGGQPLLTHIVGRLRDGFDDIVVVAAPGQVLPPTAGRVVHDEVTGQGPVVGLLTGLRAVAADIAFVTSVDAVFLRPAVVQHLVARLGDFDAAVPRWNDRLQPLTAVYRVAPAAAALADQFARGDLTLLSVFAHLRTHVIPPDDIRQVDPDGDSFFNMNTPADYEAALKRWPDAAGGAGIR